MAWNSCVVAVFILSTNAALLFLVLRLKTFTNDDVCRFISLVKHLRKTEVKIFVAVPQMSRVSPTSYPEMFLQSVSGPSQPSTRTKPLLWFNLLCQSQPQLGPSCREMSHSALNYFCRRDKRKNLHNCNFCGFVSRKCVYALECIWILNIINTWWKLINMAWSCSAF